MIFDTNFLATKHFNLVTSQVTDLQSRFTSLPFLVHVKCRSNTIPFAYNYILSEIALNCNSN